MLAAKLNWLASDATLFRLCEISLLKFPKKSFGNLRALKHAGFPPRITAPTKYFNYITGL
jgi:hypothetical protein